MIRKSVADLSPEKAKLIIDPVVRERVQESFARHGSPKKAAEAGIFHMDGRTPIRKARVRELLKRPALFPYRRGGVEIRFHRLRNNYRLDIMSTADGKYRVRMVCMLDHARATRLWERATCRGQDPLAVLPAELKSLRDGSLGKAVLQLHRGDLVGVDGLVCRVDSFSASGNVVDVVFRSHTDAAPAESAKQQRIRTVKELLARVQPIHVSILGEVSHDSTHGRSGKSGASTPG